MSTPPELTLSEKILATLLGIMGLLMLAQVIFRYLLNIPLSFSEEAARLIFVWTVFLGAAEAFRRKAHVGIDVLVRAFPERLRRGVEGVVFIVIAATLVLLVISGIKVVKTTMHSSLVTLPLPTSSLYLVIPVVCSLMLLHALWMAITWIWQWRRG